MTKKLILALIAVLAINTSYSREGFTDNFLFGGLNLNGNIYNADIQGIPGYENCCDGFGNAFGLGFGISAGAGTMLDDNFMGMPLQGFISLQYQDISATLKETDPFANLIEGNDFTLATSEHRIDPAIGLLAIEPGIILHPLVNYPLGIKLSAGLSFPLSRSFVQEEELIDPSDAVWVETNSKIRGRVEGDIEGFPSALISASIGATYTFWSSGGLDVNANLNYNYYLTGLIDNADWNASTIRAGVDLVYYLPKPALPPAEPAPLPEPPMPPEPPEPVVLTMDPEIFIDGNKVNSGDEVDYIIERRISSRVEPVLPYIFFDKNSSMLVEFERSGYSATDQLSSSIVYSNDISLRTYSISDEQSEIAKQRLDIVRSTLGLKNNVEEKIIEIDSDDLKYPQLADEYRRVDILKNGSEELYNMHIDSLVKENINSVNMNLEPNVTADAKPYKVQGMLTIGDENILYNEPIKELDLSRFFNSSSNVPVLVDMIVRDSIGNEVTEQISFTLNPDIRLVESIENLKTEGNEQFNEYTLALFDFDESEPSFIFSSAENALKDALEKGKMVEMIAMTDDLGVEYHNVKLANDRAKSIITRYSIEEGQYRIVTKEGGIYNNGSARGRIYNRSVMIRIF